MASENHTGIKIAKGFLYVLSRVVIVAAVLMLLIVAYRTAVNTMTVNMVIKDAFAKRAEVVLMPKPDGSDRDALEKLFTANAISEDPMLNSAVYTDPAYTITGYYERADVDTTLVWSWQNEATVRVTDIVRDIRATSNAVPDATGRRETPVVPEWRSGVYEVKMIKVQPTNSWMIDQIDFLETAFFEDMPAGPDLSPAPDATIPQRMDAEQVPPPGESQIAPAP